MCNVILSPHGNALIRRELCVQWHQSHMDHFNTLRMTPIQWALSTSGFIAQKLFVRRNFTNYIPILLMFNHFLHLFVWYFVLSLENSLNSLEKIFRNTSSLTSDLPMLEFIRLSKIVLIQAVITIVTNKHIENEKWNIN